MNDARWHEAAEPSKARVEELASNLAEVRNEIDEAALAAGRDPAGVTLIVVTKTFPVSDIKALIELGVRDVGESRDQEARAKYESLLHDLPEGMRWHFIGQLQTNKARSVAGYIDVVHSVDRPSLMSALGKGARLRGRNLTALVQVDLSGNTPGGDAGTDSHRGGVAREKAIDLATSIDEEVGLTLGGVMGVAPLNQSASEAYQRLAEVGGDVQRRFPSANMISGGMSEDMTDAIAAGATHVRIGAKVLGFRPAVG